MPVLVVATALAFVVACVVVDVRVRRIPNALSLPVAVAGIVINGAYLGLPGIGRSLTGLLLMVVLLLVPFALGGIGGGDVKMMGAAGALIGPWLALTGLLTGLVLGGAIAVGHLARHGRLGEKLAATGVMIGEAIRRRSLGPLRLSAIDAGAVALPYSVPLGLGIVTALAVSFI
jgi:prepilin peptidase CpaA